MESTSRCHAFVCAWTGSWPAAGTPGSSSNRRFHAAKSTTLKSTCSCSSGETTDATQCAIDFPLHPGRVLPTTIPSVKRAEMQAASTAVAMNNKIICSNK